MSTEKQDLERVYKKDYSHECTTVEKEDTKTKSFTTDVNEQEKEEEKKGLNETNVLDYDAPSFDEQKILGLRIIEYSVNNL